MENLKIYNQVRAVPETAKKPIAAGRLKGKTDVNPMWRIKKLTEVFGPAGEGWRYTIDRMWTEPGNGGEVTANVLISLYVKTGETESSAIPGIGGSMLIVQEKNGLYTDDEAYKKALTDAISVACKALGVAADVYWDKDSTKYERPALQPLICSDCGQEIKAITGKSGNPITPDKLAQISMKNHGRMLCGSCQQKKAEVKE